MKLRSGRVIGDDYVKKFLKDLLEKFVEPIILPDYQKIKGTPIPVKSR